MNNLNAYALRALLCFVFLQSASAFANSAPGIWGTPPVSTTVGTYYSFHPTFSDKDGDKLTFTTKNCPSWAACASTSGSLKGTPTTAGTYSNIVITVSDGKSTASLPAFSITVKSSSGAAATNSAPTISGSPPVTATVASAYSFQPSASDANGDKLTFGISGLPAWAAFDSTTGRLTGTPSTSYIGKSGSITIGVSDGKVISTLPAFAITVAAASSGNGSATISWLPPTQNSNGTTLTNLAGYTILYGTNSSSLANSIRLTNAGLASYVVQNLGGGTWYFGVKAFTSSGMESALSTLVSKTIK